MQAFSPNDPCQCFKKLGYQHGENESFYIRLINKVYQKDDWFTRRNFRKSGDKMKKSVCLKCNVTVHNMSKEQQVRHEQMHQHEKNNASLSEFL